MEGTAIPRTDSGVYSPPPGITAVPNTTIQSAQFNNLVQDLTQDLNTPRPISVGGTGGTTAESARAALGIGSLGQQPANNVAITGGLITGTTFRSPVGDSATAPGHSFADFPTTGMYATSTGTIGWSLAGDVKVTLGQDFRLYSGSFLAPEADTPNSPGYSWGENSTIGFFLKSTQDGIGVSINGAEKARFDANFTLLDGSVLVPPGGTGSACNYSFNGKTGNGMHYLNGDESVNLMRASSSRVKVVDGYTAFFPNGTDEVARITPAALLVGVTNPVDPSTPGGFGFSASAIGAVKISRDSAVPLEVRRGSNGGVLLNWWRGTTNVAAVTEDGSGTVAYGTFMGAHWSQGPDALPGTILQTIDELAVWPGEEFASLLPKVEIAEAGSRAVYGVWSHRDDDGDLIVAALGAYKIRIAPGAVVARGDLITCAGDGLGVPQSDDVIRSSTVGKVTSPTVLETYPDGSYLVPAVLHCG